MVEASATHLQKAESQSSRNLQKLAKPAVFISLSWASSKSRILTVGHSSCHCRSDPLSFWQLSTWDSSERIFQVAIIACHGFINIVHYLLWHGSHGTPEHAKCVTEWKTVSILQINANFLTVLTWFVWWPTSIVQNMYQRGGKRIVFSSSIQLLLSLSLFN